jgi:RNA polymerase sigma-70 factor (ECF subfamily)
MSNFSDIWLPLADRFYRVAFYLLESESDAEDAVQDVFTKYIATSPRFTDIEHERAWLVRVTVNRCHDLVRRGKIRTHESLDDITDLPSEESAEGGIMKTLSELPEKYRTAIALHYLEGFSVEEISRMLGISLSASKMRLSRGRELLKNLLTNEETNDV